MSPNKELQPVAEKIKKGTAEHAESISLDQPFPEELPPPPETEESKEPVQKEKEEKKEDEPAKILEPVEDKSEEPPTFAGYKPEDLLAAPVKPPEPVKTESRRATHTTSVVFLIAVGIILVLLGIVLLFTVSTVLGFAVALLGAIAVIVSVFTPFRK